VISIDRGPVRAVFRKEVRQFRRNRAIVVTMGILPVLFLTGPMINIFSLSASADRSTVRGVAGSVLLLMLIVPVILPAAIAAYSVVGERDQGTLEPLLTTPIRRGELMLGKALAAVVPAVFVTYLLYALFVIAVRLWAAPAVFSDVWQTPQILVEVLFVPLLATWSICIGMAISVRSTDVRVAQQLSTLASLPPVGLAVLITFRVLPATVLSAILIGLAFVILDGLACWGAAAMLDRERLIAGRRAPRRRGSPRSRS
jgi:ABC-type Na+ efflux pump permease subunit